MRPNDRMRRLLAAGLSVVALAAVVAIAVSAPWNPRRDGPIRYDGEAGVNWPAAVGQNFTWIMPLPPNPVSHDIVIRSVEPLGSAGLEILGIVITYGCDLPTTAVGFPPPGLTTRPVDGAILPANRDPCDTPSAVIGLRRNQPTTGTIDGLRVRYVSDGTTYETDLALHLEAGDP